MAPLPSRKSLESLKRADLQKLCKDYGVKANLKSEALIDLLLDTSKPVAANAPTRRSVSTRLSSRAGPSRISSIVIHDTDDEDEEETGATEMPSPDELESNAQSSSHPEPSPPPATRTKKGKEQTRLGVGRPVAAGGAGPRAITKSLSVSKKRGKGSKSMKPTEATIAEEIEPDGHDSTQEIQDETSPQANQQQVSTKHLSPEASIEALATVDKHVADALRPLHDQMKSMKSELELMQALKTEMGELKAQVLEMGSLREKVDALTTTVRDLQREADESASMRIEFSQFKKSMSAQPTPSTPKLRAHVLKKPAGPSGFGFPSSRMDTMLRRESSGSGSPAPSVAATNPSRPHPGIASTMLGKRHRDSTTTDGGEDSQPDNTTIGAAAGAGTKPTRKRAKFSQGDGDSVTEQGPSGEGTQEEASVEAEDTYDAEAVPHAPSFAIFRGLDEPPIEFMDPPPPTDHLPDFFAPPSPPLGSEAPHFSRQGSMTSTAHAAENQQPFAFSFQQPMTSTPAHGMFMPSFPYPEPPQSPSPAGTNLTGFLNQHQPGRSDVFQAFGFPHPGRPSRTGLRNTSGLGSGFINPAALGHPPSDRDHTGQDTGNGVSVSDELAARPIGAGSSTGNGTSEAPQMKRTMYGTELDGDTRFGDFGVEGVGNTKGGFWAGGRY
ncbi:hypothetical protein FPV67DRAFT_1465426 [Lyophyllum atratum]|nr:hypothetical protein FPV67DRAFT_1465426 [Lyophyllum atratum]